MENKIALVTGGNKGIGKAIAENLRKDGFHVLVIARSAKEGDDNFYQADVGNPQALEAVVETIYQTYGQIDVLVNNAGITRDNLMLKMSLEDFNEVIQTNLTSAFYLSKLVSKHMLKRRQGKIINITSVSGLHGNIGQANYSSSKAGMIGLTKTLAKEFASRGIQVNAVAPGFIQTAITDVLRDDIKETLKKQIPLQRFGNPEDVANVVSFLASDKASYITGQIISVCGGMSI